MLRESRIFFYLDAHWSEDLPLADEIERIVGNFNSFTIMMDDFEVPGDSGFAYGDYGRGKRLSLRDYPVHKDNRISAYFPSRSASRESGLSCGCIVLVNPNLEDVVDPLNCLRAVDPHSRFSFSGMSLSSCEKENRTDSFPFPSECKLFSQV